MTRGPGLCWSAGSFTALLAVLSGFWARSALAATCREGPNASPNTCSLPAGLGNFQGEKNRHKLRIYTVFPRNVDLHLCTLHTPQAILRFAWLIPGEVKRMQHTFTQLWPHRLLPVRQLCEDCSAWHKAGAC